MNWLQKEFECRFKSVTGLTQKNRPDLLEKLLEEKNAYAHDDLVKGLRIAAEKGYVECAELLLSHKARVDFHDSSGVTPLIIAARNGHTSVVKVLIQYKARVNKVTFPVRATALHWAASFGHLECVQELLDAGCSKELQTAQGRTPLMLAARSGHDDVVRALLRAGASVCRQDNQKMTALHFAAEEDNKECARLLLKAGSRINEVNVDGMTPLMVAAGRGQYDVMKLLLCDLKIKIGGKSRQLSLMHWAAQSGCKECVELLVDYSVDADPQAEGCYSGGDLIVNKGVSPLMLACGQGFVDIVSVLIKAGANVNAYDEDCCTPLTYAIKKDHATCVLKLIENGANFDGFLTDVDLCVGGIWPQFCYPLFLAIQEGACNCLKILLKANCALTIVGYNKHGYPMTPLELAMFKINSVAVKMLLLAGFPPLMINSSIFEEGFNLLSESDEELCLKLTERFQNPLPLMELARICIRRCLGTAAMKDISKLPLPHYLVEFMNLKDLDSF